MDQNRIDTAQGAQAHVHLTHAQRIERTIGKFPPIFGLRGYAGTFKIGLDSSFIDDSNHVVLYTQQLHNGVWQDFVKCSITELKDQLVRL